MMGKTRVLARATLNGLAGRVVARGPPVAHHCSKHSLSGPIQISLLSIPLFAFIIRVAVKFLRVQVI